MSAEILVVDLVFRSASGASLSSVAPGDELSLEDYAATPATREAAEAALVELGFEIVGPVTVFGVTVSGPRELVQAVFGRDELTVPGSLRRWIESARNPPPAEFFVP